MASKKRLTIRVDQNRLVLPQALISEKTEAYTCELQADGRIVLSPVAAAASDKIVKPAEPLQRPTDFPNVIDFRESQARLKKPMQKNKKAPKVSKTKTEDTSGSETGFVKLHLFPSRLEAEMVGEILKQAEIPYLIQSEDIGIFGPGAAPAPGGARLRVRKADLEYAKVILAGLI